MPEDYGDAIVKFLKARSYTPLKPRQLARQLGVKEEDYGTFREAVKQLQEAGRVVLGTKNALTLPTMGPTVVGTYRANPRGFGFVIPETPNAHGDLYIPKGMDGGAITGDHVAARVSKQRRDGEAVFHGEIVHVLKRGRNRFVGTLQTNEGVWFVLPDGSAMATPIVVRDLGPSPREGVKVVVEIVRYPRGAGELPAVVIVETLGARGEIEVETLSVIRARGLEDTFSEAAMAEARAAVERFDPRAPLEQGREDLTGLTVVTIDPPDARDYDDAISIARGADGAVTLGVHIADVSYFVVEGGALDADAKRRSTSVYFPRKVIPMLPEVLSNGVCSLQEGERRLCKSVFIRYDEQARPAGARLAETVICSARRLTYVAAQRIIDGGGGEGVPAEVAALLVEANELARRIEVRRRAAGMLHLDLPEVELVFDDQDRVIDAVPEDQSYTHSMIEMFMVEANEAVARALDERGRAFLRRIHPDPDATSGKPLASFLRACGHKIAANLTRHDLQRLLEAVRGRPEEYAVNLAVLRTFESAEYSPLQVGHFALASSCYCHFTSPIRRYPDLTVHRLVAELCRGTLGSRPPEDLAALKEQGETCSAAERRAEAAEDELREVLVLQMLAGRVGDEFDGVVTGVGNFGLFVQSRKYLVEGLVRMPDLGDDWWEVDADRGQLRGQHTAKVYRIGDILPVRIASVDLSRRELNLVPRRKAGSEKGEARPPAKRSGRKGRPGKKERGEKRRK